MTTTQRQLLALLHRALDPTSAIEECLTQEPIDWETMWTLADEQSVIGLVADAMMQLPEPSLPDRRVRLMWIAAAYQIELRNAEVNRAMAKLARVLDEADIPYVYMKGQTVAAYYRKPAMRQPGDVDFYVPASHYDLAKEVIGRQLKVEVEGEGKADKHDAFDYRGVHFEMHYRIETFGTEKHQARFDQRIDDCLATAVYRDVECASVRVLPEVEEMAATFKHLFNHLLMEGVGLKQFCDMSVLLVPFPKESTQQLISLLEDVGYLKAFRAMYATLMQYMGLSVDVLPITLTPADSRWTERLIEVPLQHGNFGKHHRWNSTNRWIKKTDTALLALRHCLRFLPLAPPEIACLLPRRMAIALAPR